MLVFASQINKQPRIPKKIPYLDLN
jgi:hypothetical protein